MPNDSTGIPAAECVVQEIAGPSNSPSHQGEGWGGGDFASIGTFELGGSTPPP